MQNNTNIDLSVTDKKDYRIITLSNELKVVLISDLTSKISEQENEDDSIIKSAVALCIGVGSFNEPSQINGLAHYLEHMVFMGSEKFPNENDFDSSVSQNGGSSNAFTDAERTCFHFDSHKSHFVELLDKFANFFINPLMLKSSMDREVTAVHSEFEMSYSDDNVRLEYLVGSLAKQGSPYTFFSYGNQKSLNDIPKANNIDIYKFLQEFRKTKYSSHMMTLAVQSRESLDDIEAYVSEIFSKIPHNGLPKDDLSIHEEPFKTAAFNRYYTIVPVKDVKRLCIFWHFPSMLKEYKSKSVDIVSHLIGHEGEGSLLNYLRKINYALDLQCGINADDAYRNSSFCAIFEVRIYLTDIGFENIDKIIESLYSYITMLKQGIPDRLYEEYRALRYSDFLFKEESEPLDTVVKLSTNMHLYEDQHLHSGSSLLFEKKPDLVQQVIELLTVQQMNICVLSKTFQSKTDCVSDWYDIEYSVRDFSSNEINAWQNPTFMPQLHLPNENKFLATDFSLLELDSSLIAPLNILEAKFIDLAAYGEMWYKFDNKFKVPKAHIDFYFQNFEFTDSILTSTLLSILLYAINQKMYNVTYDGILAGLSYSLHKSNSGVSLSIEGFSHKIFEFYQLIIDYLATFDINDEQLSVYKESEKRSLINSTIDSKHLSRGLLHKVLKCNTFLNLEGLAVLPDVTIDKLKKLHETMFHNATVAGYCHGNLTAETARNCFQYAVEKLNIKPNGRKQKSKIRVVPNGCHRIRVKSLNPTDCNTSIDIFYQIPNMTLEQDSYNEFLVHILNEPCFDFLRTKETLGYAVGMYEKTYNGLYGMGFQVLSQANKFTLDHCHSKMIEFITDKAVNFLQELNDADYNEFKESFIANKLEEDTKMSDEVQRNWFEISTNNYIFDRRFQTVGVVENISKEQLIAFFQYHYLTGDIHKIIVEVDSEDQVEKKMKRETNDLDLKLHYYLDESQQMLTAERIIEKCDITYRF